MKEMASREKLGQVLAPVIEIGDLLVFELSCILKEDSASWGDVQDVLDAKLSNTSGWWRSLAHPK